MAQIILYSKALGLSELSSCFKNSNVQVESTSDESVLLKMLDGAQMVLLDEKIGQEHILDLNNRLVSDGSEAIRVFIVDSWPTKELIKHQRGEDAADAYLFHPLDYDQTYDILSPLLGLEASTAESSDEDSDERASKVLEERQKYNTSVFVENELQEGLREFDATHSGLSVEDDSLQGEAEVSEGLEKEVTLDVTPSLPVEELSEEDQAQDGLESAKEDGPLELPELDELEIEVPSTPEASELNLELGDDSLEDLNLGAVSADEAHSEAVHIEVDPASEEHTGPGLEFDFDNEPDSQSSDKGLEVELEGEVGAFELEDDGSSCVEPILQNDNGGLEVELDGPVDSLELEGDDASSGEIANNGPEAPEIQEFDLEAPADEPSASLSFNLGEESPELSDGSDSFLSDFSEEESSTEEVSEGLVINSSEDGPSSLSIEGIDKDDATEMIGLPVDFDKEAEVSVPDEGQLSFSGGVVEEDVQDNVLEREDTEAGNEAIAGTSEVPEEKLPSSVVNAEALGLAMEEIKMERKELLEQHKVFEGRARAYELKNRELELSLQESQIEANLYKKRWSEETESLKENLGSRDIQLAKARERISTLEKKFQEEVEGQRVNTEDIRRREKELEQKLELSQMDASSQIQSRESKILELKRRVDSLEFNIEALKKSEAGAMDKAGRLEIKLDHLMQSLKGSLQNIESDLDHDEFNAVD